MKNSDVGPVAVRGRRRRRAVALAAGLRASGTTCYITAADSQTGCTTVNIG